MFVSVLGVVATSCSHQSNATDTWNPKTERLDQLSLDDTNFASFANDVKKFYELLRKKDWKATYERRWKTFRQDLPEELYLNLAKKEGSNWGLQDFEILSIETHDSNKATLICKFVELPGSTVVYSTVRWHKEDDIWKCDIAGPSDLTIFRYTRNVEQDGNQ
jgi:hypothetical protein